ncbi:MAG: serine/threonine protein kinase [Polyangiaceae bacterium]|nr:serine/threonine protein kinase [Polyangiaceae bacterium]
MLSGLDQLKEGDLFAGRYRVVRPIGRGGFGALYEVTDERTRGKRALKVLLPGALTSSDLRARFTREAQLTGAIEGDHVVRVLDASATDELPYIVMELLTGEDLEATLKRDGRLAPAAALVLLAQAARGLDRTHATGVVHRDIKPENLYVTRREDGSPCLKLVDFGLAKVSAPKGAPTTRVIGTPLYMAPEQVRGDGDVSPRADLYGLAQVAYSLLGGEPYFAVEVEQGVLALMVHICRGGQERATERASRRRRVALPPAFDGWFAKATALDPRERFGSALEQIDALRAAYEAAPAAGPATEPTLDVRAALAHDLTAAQASPRALSMEAPPIAQGSAIENESTAFAVRESPAARSIELRAPQPSPQAASLQAPRPVLAPAMTGPRTAVSPTAAPHTAMRPLPPAPPRRAVRASGAGRLAWVLVALLAATAAGIAVWWSVSGDEPTSKRRSSREDTPRKQRDPRSSAPSVAPRPNQPEVELTSHPAGGCELPTCAPFAPKDRSKVTSTELLELYGAAAAAVEPEAKLLHLSIPMFFSAVGVDTSEKHSFVQALFTTPRGVLKVSHHEGKLLISHEGDSRLEPVAPFGACTLERAVAIAQREGVVFGSEATTQSAFYGRYDDVRGGWSVQSSGHVLVIIAPSCTVQSHGVHKELQ